MLFLGPLLTSPPLRVINIFIKKSKFYRRFCFRAKLRGLKVPKKIPIPRLKLRLLGLGVLPPDLA